HARRRPRRGVARGDLPGVGEAGPARRARLAVDHGHLEAGARQVPRAGHADHTTAKNQDTLHRTLRQELSLPRTPEPWNARILPPRFRDYFLIFRTYPGLCP